VHGARAAESVGRDLAEADRADRPGFDVAGEFADRILDRDPPVDPVDVIEVDPVDSEPSQRPLQAVADVLGTVVEHAPAVGLTTNGELGRESNSGAAAYVLGQEFADHRLADALAVDVGGVPEVDAELERPRERTHRLALVRRSVEAAETHAAEADRRNRSVTPKPPAIHRPPLELSWMDGSIDGADAPGSSSPFR